MNSIEQILWAVCAVEHGQLMQHAFKIVKLMLQTGFRFGFSCQDH